MKHFWRKPGKTLIYVLSLFMTIGLLGIPVYAENQDDNDTSGTGQEPTETDTNLNGTETGNQTDIGTDGGVIPGDNGTTDGKITVKLQDTAPEDLKNYLSAHSSELILDIYKVADAVKDSNYDTYTYRPVTGFAVDGYDLNTYNGLKEFDTDKWKDLSQELITIVKNSTSSIAHDTATYNVQKTGLHHGLYLILAHGDMRDYYETTTETIPATEEGKADTVITETATVFETDTHRYLFRPILLAIPSTVDNNLTPTTTDKTPWKYELDVYLKPSAKPLYGSLVINKVVQELNDRHIGSNPITPVTVVFRITGWKSSEKKTDEKVYSNVASITIPTGSPVTLDHIPVGTYVEVTEEYTGAGYTRVLAEGEQEVLSAVIPDPDKSPAQATFTFKDTYDDRLKKGYGIMNTFTKTETDNWSWKNDAGQSSAPTTPASSETAEGGTQG